MGLVDMIELLPDGHQDCPFYAGLLAAAGRTASDHLFSEYEARVRRRRCE